MKKLLFILAWLTSLVAISIYVNENPEKIENIKDYFTKDEKPELVLDDGGKIQRQPGNSFIIEFQKVVSLSEKTAFSVDYLRNSLSESIDKYHRNHILSLEFFQSLKEAGIYLKKGRYTLGCKLNRQF